MDSVNVGFREKGQSGEETHTRAAVRNWSEKSTPRRSRNRCLYLECIDESQVVERDVVVVVLDVAERLLVVLHERVDLSVLAFLDLVYLRLASQVEFVSQRSHLLLVLVFNLVRLSYKVVPLLGQQHVLLLDRGR